MRKSVTLTMITAVLLMAVVCLGTVATVLAQQGTAKTYEDMTPAERTAEIKREGMIVSYGMPDSWANLGEIWKVFTEKYGIKHIDTDMSSAEELTKFLVEKNKPVADVGDIGIMFGPKGVEMDVLASHKNPYWNEIPDWAKDPNGYWCAEYTGTIAFIVNTKKVKNVPSSFVDLLKPEYAGKVSIDDPARSAQGQAGVLAAAIANGGDEKDIQPGIDFFKNLVKLGNYRPVLPLPGNLQSGEVAIGIMWDFNALSYKASLDMPELTVVIPGDGSLVMPYVAVINKYAPHPIAARALNDFLFSDEGQIMYAKGFARPIRNVKLPPEVAARMLPTSAYDNARPVRDFKVWEETAKGIGQLWEEQVLGQ